MFPVNKAKLASIVIAMQMYKELRFGFCQTYIEMVMLYPSHVKHASNFGPALILYRRSDL